MSTGDARTFDDDVYANIVALRKSTHTHIIGGSRSGKSKFIEWLIRNDIAERQPFCIIDWHGTLYRDVLQYLAYARPRREFVLLNPAVPDFITGFNPFMGSGQDISAMVARRVAAVARAWGVADTNEMPTFERLATMVFDFTARTREPLPNGALLLRRHKKELRQYALRVITDSHMREEWWDVIETAKRPRDWHFEVLAVRNRFMRLLRSTGIRRFMGLKTGNLDIRQALEGGKNVLVNLANTDLLDRQAAGVFAALFLNEFFEAAMNRAGTDKLYTLYLDEFQEYITPDLGDMLDQVLKGGLHVVLAHHHLGQLKEDARLRKSISQNARMRFVFGMGDFEDAAYLANEMFLGEINQRQVEEEYWHPAAKMRVETGYSHSVSEGGDNTITTTSSHDMLIPEYDLVKSGASVTSHPEKVSRAAERLINVEQRGCFGKLDKAKTARFEVPVLDTYYVTAERLAARERELYEKQGARPAAEVDRLLEESEREFIRTANAAVKDDKQEFVTRKRLDGKRTDSRMKPHGHRNGRDDEDTQVPVR